MKLNQLRRAEPLAFVCVLVALCWWKSEVMTDALCCPVSSLGVHDETSILVACLLLLASRKQHSSAVVQGFMKVIKLVWFVWWLKRQACHAADVIHIKKSQHYNIHTEEFIAGRCIRLDDF